MKKIIALVLALTLVLPILASCGAINKDGEVSVIWSNMEDEYLATIADALDRAMYIENINYTHYDAKGNSAELLGLVDRAISGGAVALVVSADDSVSALAVVEKAKAANIPLIFLCNNIALPETVFEVYEKCYAINVNNSSLYETLGTKIAEDLLEKYDDYDRNDDGKISYAAFGTSGLCVDVINKKLAEEEKPALIADALNVALPTVGVTETVNKLFADYDGSGDEVNATPVELILTDDDAYVSEMLMALRKYELNYKKLVTHYIPLYTVGIAANAADVKYGVAEGELDEDDREMRAAYSVMNAIDDGYLSAAALENDDELALSCAVILRNFIKGNEILEDVVGEYISGKRILVPYTIY